MQPETVGGVINCVAYAKGRRVALIEGCRTPFVKAFAEYNGLTSLDLSRLAAKESLYRAGLRPSDVDQVVWSTTIPVLRYPNLGREVALASLYVALDRLAAKGHVVSELGDPSPERGGRAKRYFSLTPQGRREVRDAQRLLTSLWRDIPSLAGGRA